MNIARSLAILIPLGLLGLSFCGEGTVKVPLSEVSSHLKTVVLYSGGAKSATVKRQWSTVARARAANVFFLKPLASPYLFEGQQVTLAVLYRASDASELATLRSAVETSAARRIFRPVAAVQAIPQTVTNDFSRFTHLAIVLEQRSNSFLKLPSRGKQSLLQGEDSTFTNNNPTSSIDSNWVTSGGHHHVLRLLGLADEFNWGSLQLGGLYYRMLNKNERSTVLPGRLVRSGEIDLLLQ